MSVLANFTPVLKEITERLPESAVPKEPKNIDKGNNSFKKLFYEKRIEKDGLPSPKKKGEASEIDKHVARLKIKRESLRDAIARIRAIGEQKKSVPLKEILAALVDTKKKSESVSKKDKNAGREAGKMAVDPYAGRDIRFIEKLGTGKKNAVDNAITAEKKTAADRKVVVVDLRDHVSEKLKAGASVIKNNVKNTKVTEKTDIRKSTDQRDQIEVKFFSKTPGMNEISDAQKGGRVAEPVDVKTFSSSRLTQVVNNEMVKQTGIIVKNGGSGEIHLVLKPESLGSVRIKMNIEENHIVGKIIVDNNTVKEIMEENLGNLETALRDSGYGNATFDVSVAGEKRGKNGQESEFASMLEGGESVGKSALKEYSTSDFSIYDDALINIVL